MLYDEELHLLIINFMPSRLHEAATMELTVEVISKLRVLGRPLCSMGATRYGNPRVRSKEADVVFRPHTHPKDDWPSLVIEVGISESLRQL